MSSEPLLLMLTLAGPDRARLERMAELTGRTKEDICVLLVRRLDPELVKAKGANIAVCSGCGLPYTPERRPRKGQRHYCPECREKGRDAADRQARYRAKQTNGVG